MAATSCCTERAGDSDGGGGGGVVIDDFVVVPCHSSSGSQRSSENVRIGVFQVAHFSPDQATTLPLTTLARLRTRLELLQRDERLPDIAILPEEWLASSKFFDHSSQDTTGLCALAKEFGIHLLLGTTLEHARSSTPPHKLATYCTAIFVGADGNVLGTYRKRKPTTAHLDGGSQALVVDTALGRIAVLICFDIENADILHETLQAKPDIILNPIYILAPPTLTTQPIELRSSTWNIAMESVSRKFEALATEHSLTLVRCDLPCHAPLSLLGNHHPSGHTRELIRFSGALGSSLIVDRVGSYYAPSMQDCSMVVETHNRLGSHSTAPRDLRGSPLLYMRSERVDNTGNRFAVKCLDGVSHLARWRDAVPLHKLPTHATAAVTCLSANLRDVQATTTTTPAASTTKHRADRILWAGYADGLICPWNIFNACAASAPLGATDASAVLALANAGDAHVLSAHIDRSIRWWDGARASIDCVPVVHLDAARATDIDVASALTALAATDIGSSVFICGDATGAMSVLDVRATDPNVMRFASKHASSMHSRAVRSIVVSNDHSAVACIANDIVAFDVRATRDTLISPRAWCHAPPTDTTSSTLAACHVLSSRACANGASTTDVIAASWSGEMLHGTLDLQHCNSTANVLHRNSNAAAITALVHLSNDAHFATCDNRGSVKLWDLKATADQVSLSERYSIQVDSSLSCMAYNGHKMYIGRADGNISIVQAEKNRTPCTWGDMLRLPDNQ
jgi:predicted amidohydrolase/WD40 repeat protein